VKSTRKQQLVVEIDPALLNQVNRMRGTRRLARFVEDALWAEVERTIEERAVIAAQAKRSKRRRGRAVDGFDAVMPTPRTQSSAAFIAGARREISRVFATTTLPDHRQDAPGVDACLGNPFAPVWFVGENPSLKQLERAPSRALRDPEMQWGVSRGDKLFRQMLSRHGFKTGGEFEPGGWNCYITDVVKSAHPAGKWRQLRKAQRCAVAELWAPVLAWELAYGTPKLIVALGDKVDELLDHLVANALIPSLPERRKIDHYAYITDHPESRPGPLYRLGPGNERRVATYSDAFAEIARAVGDRGDRSRRW
jgi:hypothetical protein